MIPHHARQLLKSALPTAGSPAVWVFDVDDTITDTRLMHHRAAESVTQALSAHMPLDLAQSIAKRFRDVFDELLINHQQNPRSSADTRKSSDELEARARGYQKEIAAIWGFSRLFSREVLLQIAVEDCGASLTPPELRHCVDAYWEHLFENPIIFEDTVRLTQELARRHVPTYLMTSSDARYYQQPTGQFTYNPAESRDDKRRRLDNLRRYGVEYRRAFIGDPIDKPTKEFFRLAFSGIAEDLHRSVGSFRIVVVGDSFRSDIETPLELLDSSIGILYRHGQTMIDVESERVVSVGDFDGFIEDLDIPEGR